MKGEKANSSCALVLQNKIKCKKKVVNFFQKTGKGLRGDETLMSKLKEKTSSFKLYLS